MRPRRSARDRAFPPVFSQPAGGLKGPGASRFAGCRGGGPRGCQHAPRCCSSRHSSRLVHGLSVAVPPVEGSREGRQFRRGGQGMEPKTYPDGVTSWIDTEQQDLEAAQRFTADSSGGRSPRPHPGGAAVRYVVAQLDGRDVAGLSWPTGCTSTVAGAQDEGRRGRGRAGELVDVEHLRRRQRRRRRSRARPGLRWAGPRGASPTRAKPGAARSAPIRPGSPSACGRRRRPGARAVNVPGAGTATCTSYSGSPPSTPSLRLGLRRPRLRVDDPPTGYGGHLEATRPRYPEPPRSCRPTRLRGRDHGAPAGEGEAPHCTCRSPSRPRRAGLPSSGSAAPSCRARTPSGPRRRWSRIRRERASPSASSTRRGFDACPPA